MDEWHKAKYRKAPTDAEGIAREFEKEHIYEDLGKSLHKDKGIFYNGVQIEENFSNCIFSSEKSIQLIEDFVEKKDQFFLMDGTFRITPRGTFQQVLILYAAFGIKVFSIFYFEFK